ncbi:MAG: response regulator [Bdellovibrionales bacterium]|nr:response regulator [Bdellovibrionales bacterium]
MSFNFLLVDDSSIVRKSLKKTLALTDLDIAAVVEASNGEEALKALRENWIDLVFLDINMPVMNGVQFMQALSQSEDLSDTKVLIVSTEGSSERIEELQMLGALGYLRKPFTPEEVVEKVADLLKGGSNG